MAKTDDRMIAALLRERDGYLARGQKDRAALVDEQLSLRGYEPPADERPADTGPEADPATAAPRGRGGRPRNTA